MEPTRSGDMQASREPQSQSLRQPQNPHNHHKPTSNTKAQGDRSNPAGEAEEAVDVKRPKDSVFYDGLYAPSGFDMMSILIRVVRRPNPQIDIGAVDSNAAITLVDTYAHDSPIVYCSEGFERLTGYTTPEVLGRNCRFLQFPPATSQDQQGPKDHKGKTSPTRQRRSTRHTQSGKSQQAEHEENLARLRQCLSAGSECQAAIVNYKKNGAQFTNLLTVIPISWDSDDKFRYAVGFQTDLQSCLFAA